MDHVSKELSEVAPIAREAEPGQIASELHDASGQALGAVLPDIERLLNDCRRVGNDDHPARHLGTGYRDLGQPLSRVGARLERSCRASVSPVSHPLPQSSSHLSSWSASGKRQSSNRAGIDVRRDFDLPRWCAPANGNSTPDCARSSPQHHYSFILSSGPCRRTQSATANNGTPDSELAACGKQ